jgi:large subunit ribosomal protein L18
LEPRKNPRLSVYKSNKYIYAQLIDDVGCKTLTSVSTLSKEIKDEVKKMKKTEASKAVGVLLAKKAVQLGIKKVVFDRNGFLYHGRIKALANGARENGLKF